MFWRLEVIVDIWEVGGLMLVEKAKLSRNFLAEMNAKSKVQKTFILFFSSWRALSIPTLATPHHCDFMAYSCNRVFYIWSVEQPAKHTDCRCEDGRFLVSASCVTIPKPDSHSSWETGVNPGLRSWESTFLDEIDVSLVVGISQRSERLRLYNADKH